jgi:hypothetical protein
MSDPAPARDDRDSSPGPDPDHVRVHYGMTGSVPLRLFEFVFEPAGCYLLDCGAFTPLFGLASGGHRRRAAALDAAYADHGVDGLLASADTVTWLSVDRIERVTLHDGGWVARPKLSVATTGDAPARSVRLHGVDVDALADALGTLAGDGLRIDRASGAGLL